MSTSRPKGITSWLLVAVTGALAAGVITVAIQNQRGHYLARFHEFYYQQQVWDKQTSWLGTRIQKLPLDLMVYQEILHERRPDVVIETGTLEGGSARFFANHGLDRARADHHDRY